MAFLGTAAGGALASGAGAAASGAAQAGAAAQPHAGDANVGAGIGGSGTGIGKSMSDIQSRTGFGGQGGGAAGGPMPIGQLLAMNELGIQPGMGGSGQPPRSPFESLYSNRMGTGPQ